MTNPKERPALNEGRTALDFAELQLTKTVTELLKTKDALNKADMELDKTRLELSAIKEILEISKTNGRDKEKIHTGSARPRPRSPRPSPG